MAVNAMDRAKPGIALPVIAGLAAAVAGGVIWALILKYTQWEIGIVAWAIGLVTAFAVGAAAKGYRDRTLQILAVVAALIGILVGKYLGWMLWGEDNGYASVTDMFGWFDALWIGLAVITAWQMLEPRDREPETALESPRSTE